MKTIKIHFWMLLLAAVICTAFSANGQKPYFKDPAEIAEAATQQLDELMKDEKVQKEIAKKNIHGDYTYKVTINGKSQIAGMQFLNKSDNASVMGQNHFNYLVKKQKFNFKVPKGNYYTLEYTFKVP